MDSTLIAGVVAIALGVVVVVVGLRRDLAEVTRSWLPRFDEPPETAMATLEEVERGRGRRQLSSRERKFLTGAYLVFGLFYATDAVLSGDSRPQHVIFAVLFGILAVLFALKKLPFRRGDQA